MTPSPWTRDPADLPDNRMAAFGMLLSPEGLSGILTTQEYIKSRYKI